MVSSSLLVLVAATSHALLSDSYRLGGAPRPLRRVSMVAVDRPPVQPSLKYSPVYSFGKGRASPGKDMKFLLGGKGNHRSSLTHSTPYI